MPSQHVDDDGAGMVVVVHHQGAPAAQVEAGQQLPRVGRADAQPGAEPERAALARVRSPRRPRRPSARPAAWRSPGRGPCRRTCGWWRRRPAESLEQAARLLGREADAGVAAPGSAAARPCRCVRWRRTRDDDLALLGELDRVVREVDQDLAQPQRVAHQVARHVGRDVEHQLQPLGVGLLADQVRDVVQQLVEVEVDRARGRACPPRSWRSRGCR